MADARKFASGDSNGPAGDDGGPSSQDSKATEEYEGQSPSRTEDVAPAGVSRPREQEPTGETPPAKRPRAMMPAEQEEAPAAESAEESGEAHAPPALLETDLVAPSAHSASVARLANPPAPAGGSPEGGSQQGRPATGSPPRPPARFGPITPTVPSSEATAAGRAWLTREEREADLLRRQMLVVRREAALRGWADELRARELRVRQQEEAAGGGSGGEETEELRGSLQDEAAVRRPPVACRFGPGFFEWS